MRNQHHILMLLSCALSSHPSRAQVPKAASMEIEVSNLAAYNADVFDTSKFASDPNGTTPAVVKNFGFSLAIGDITLVNGKPAKGTVVIHSRLIALSPTPGPGQAIADTTGSQAANIYFEFQQADGRPVGTIHTFGLAGGAGPVGAPAGAGKFAIAGGTGAFVGVRGQMFGRAIPGVRPSRNASATEDPARRRDLAAGERAQYVLQIVPMIMPAVVSTLDGPAITHSADFSLVTSTKPAKPGEILSLFAVGLGPVSAGADPDKPFAADPLSLVSSPIDVIVNGRPAEVLGAAGYPGTQDRYQVNFRIPADARSGSATVQVIAAWIAGPEVKISISQ